MTAVSSFSMNSNEPQVLLELRHDYVGENIITLIFQGSFSIFRNFPQRKIEIVA